MGRVCVALVLLAGVAAVVSVREVATPALATHAPAGTRAAELRQRLLGLITHGQRPAELLALDPLTLRSSGSRLRVGWDTVPVAFSPNGRTLALARAYYGHGAIEFVDTNSLEVRGVLPRALGLNIAAAAWPAPRRLLAVSWDCCPSVTRFALIDPLTRRVLKRRVIAQGDIVVAHALTGHGLALLGAPRGVIGDTRLLTVDEGGRERSVVLRGILAGANAAANRQRIPGLAVDPSGRAFVADAEDSLAEVNLATLAVRYHSLRRAQPASRVRAWFEPAAAAKGYVGPVRHAIWLGHGRLAVSGADWEGTDGDRAKPAGLAVIDTPSWSVRTLDRNAAAAAVADGVLVGFGGGFRDPLVDRAQGAGLVAYDLAGVRRFAVFPRQPNTLVAVAGHYAYLSPVGSYGLSVVDLRSGRIASRPQLSSLPLLLTPGANAP